MTYSIIIDGAVQPLLVGSAQGAQYTFERAKTMVSAEEVALLEYSTGTGWRVVDMNAYANLSTILNSFVSIQTPFPKSLSVERVLSDLNTYLIPESNVFLSPWEVVALLLNAMDSYAPGVQVGTSRVIAASPVVEVNSFTERKTSQGEGTIRVGDENTYFPFWEYSTYGALWFCDESIAFHGVVGGSQARARIYGSNTTIPRIDEYGFLVNAAELVSVATSDYIVASKGISYKADPAGHAWYVISRQSETTAKFSTYYTESGGLARDYLGGAIPTGYQTQFEIPKHAYKYWCIAFEYVTGVIHVPSAGPYPYAECPPFLFQPNLSNAKYSRNVADSGVTFHIDAPSKTITAGDGVTTTVDDWYGHWYGLSQDTRSFTAGRKFNVSYEHVLNYSGMAGGVGNLLLPVGQPYGQVHGETSNPTITSAVTFTINSTNDVSTYVEQVVPLISRSALAVVDVVNLPNYHSQVLLYPLLSQAFDKMVRVDDPMLDLVASYTALLVTRTILDEALIALVTGGDMRQTYGVDGDTPLLYDSNHNLVSVNDARSSADCEYIAADYTQFEMELQDRMGTCSILMSSGNTNDAVSELRVSVAQAAQSTILEALLMSVRDKADADAIVYDTFATLSGPDQYADIMDAASRAGAQSLSDVLQFIDAYAPSYSVSLPDQADKDRFVAILNASNYDGYSDYFTDHTKAASSSSTPWFTKIGAGYVQADTEGEVFDSHFGCEAIWPPVVSTLAVMPAEFTSAMHGKVFTVPFRSSYMVVHPSVSGGVCQVLWLARYSGGGDENCVRALTTSWSEFCTIGQKLMRAASSDPNLYVTAQGFSTAVDPNAAYDPTTRELENALSVLTFAGSGAIVGAAAGPVGATVGAGVGTAVGLNLAFTTGSGGGDSDMWNVAESRELIKTAASSMVVTTTTPDNVFESSDPVQCRYNIAALLAYCVYRGIWAPMQHEGETPVGYGLMTDVIITPRYYLMSGTTDYVPMIATIGAAVMALGVASYVKRTKINGSKSRLHTTYTKDNDGNLVGTTDLPQLSFGSIRGRSCIPAVALGSATSWVTAATSGVSTAVKDRAEQSRYLALYDADSHITNVLDNTVVPNLNSVIADVSEVKQILQDGINDLKTKDTRMYFM